MGGGQEKPPRIWQIGLPYLNQEGETIPTKFADHPTDLIDGRKGGGVEGG